jgi:GNAT superfamily N-acetyltransferase
MIELRPISPDMFAEALDYVSREFLAGSVLHQSLQISEAEYAQYLTGSVSDMIGQGASFAAMDCHSGRWVGCIFATELSKPASKHLLGPEIMLPIKRLLYELEFGYFNVRGDDELRTLLVDMAVVSPDMQGLGIYTRLRRAVHQRAVELGFEYVVGELASAAAQHLCVHKLGHRIIHEINFSDFVYNDKHPFADIKEPPSIQMVEYRFTLED